jgi:hypothetical protein
LVRPNQGLIQPGQAETVQIMLVDKDKHQLLESYQSLGMAALEHCKDKFLVQSVAVPEQQAAHLQSYDSLTALWTSNPTAVANKKLHVRHTVMAHLIRPGMTTSSSSSSSRGTIGTSASGSTVVASNRTTTATAYVAPKDMTQEQMIIELTSLRRKYDELIAFSVNLTAERDMLSNTLELTKRDLHRTLAGKNTATASTGVAAATPIHASARGGSTGGTSWMMMVIYILVAFGMGVMVQQSGHLQPWVHILLPSNAPTSIASGKTISTTTTTSTTPPSMPIPSTDGMADEL